MLEYCALIGPAQPIIAGTLISVFSMIFIFSGNSEFGSEQSLQENKI